jgi:hypothetical protein
MKITYKDGFILEEKRVYRNHLYQKSVTLISMSQHGKSKFMKNIVNYKFLTIRQIVEDEGFEVQLVFQEAYEFCDANDGNRNICGCYSYSKKFLSDYLTIVNRRFEI